MGKSTISIFLVLFITCLNAGNGNYLRNFDPKKTLQSITFTENKGQVSDQNNKPRPDVLFGGVAGNMAFHLRNNGISYQLNRIDSWMDEDTLLNPQSKMLSQEKRKVPDQFTIYRVDVNWLNCNKNFKIISDAASPGYNNYYHNVCPNGVHNVKTYTGITYVNIYNGIDLHYYEKQDNLKFDFIVAPHTDYHKIQLQIQGAEKISIQKDGSVLIKTPLGEISEETPITFQNGKQLFAKWVVKENVLSFEIENYNPALPLIIDPATRAWGTYYGGNGFEVGSSCSTDASGNVYMAGRTLSNTGTVIATTGSHQSNHGGNSSWDAFLVKFNSNGVRLWGTYYGDWMADQGYSCATDVSGNVYLAGHSVAPTISSSATIIATSGSHQSAYGGGTWDAFLVKFNSNGVRLWGTYYGGSGSELGRSCFTDPSGNVYLTGETTSNTGTVIATPGCHQSTFGGGTNDVFLVKFSSNGLRLWGTYYGGIGYDWFSSCTTDAFGNVYLTAETDCSTGTVIATAGSHQSTFGGATNDAFLVKFNSSGLRLWGTYYGGTGQEWYPYCTTDAMGNVYLCGTTTSTAGTVIATVGSHQSANSGGNANGFLVKFNSSGVRLWGTYYGGTGGIYNTGFFSCVSDLSGNIYTSGATSCNTGSLIATVGSHQISYGGGTSNAILAKFDNNGVRLWGTYYGGIGNDLGYSCAVDAMSNIYLSGQTTGATGTVIASVGSHQTSDNGGSDAFLAKFYGCDFALMTNSTGSLNLFRCSGQTTTLNVSSTGTLSWYSSPTSTSVLGTGTVFMTPALAVGTATYYSQSSNSCGINPVRLAITVTVASTPTIAANSGSVCLGKSFTITPSGAFTYSLSGGSLVVAPLITSNYTITGTGTNGCVNSLGAISNVSVVNPPAISVNSGTICHGNTFTILPSGASSYTFTGGNNLVSPLTTSSYTVTGTGISGCVNTVGAVSTVTVRPTPTITANSGSICSGQSFTIIPSGASTYSYSGGSNIVNPVSTINYTVTGTNTAGCSNTVGAISSITVISSPSISANNGTICNGQSFTINPHGANTYTISGGNFVVSPTTNTNYSVTGTSTDGCLGNTVVASVTVNPLPNITAVSNPSSICFGESAVLTASGANNYTWLPSGNTNTILATPNTNTTYSVTGTNNNNCSNTATISVLVKPNPTVSVNNATVCTGTQAILNANVNPNTGLVYNWLPGGENTSSITVIPNATSVYSVSVNLDGCLSMATSTLNVVTAITPNVAFSYNGPYCTNQNSVSPNLTLTFANGGQFFSTPQGLNLNPNTGVIDPTNSEPGTYQITYTLSASGCSTSASGTANIQITPPTQLNLAPQVTLLTGESHTLNVSGGSSYTWSPPDYLSCTTCSNPIANPPQSMTYCVSSPDDVCIAKTCISINVETGCEGRELGLPNAFTPNGDGNNDEFCLRGWNECIAEFKIMVYNRWGEKVYESEQTEFCWDGSYKGKTQETEVFVYTLKAKLKDGTQISKNGNITLLR